MKTSKRRRLWWALLIPASIAVGLFLYFIMPFEPINRPTVVARGHLACGDVLLTQSFTGTTEPYVVSFYFRPPGSAMWAEYYVDHDSPFWRGTLQIAPSGDSCGLILYGSETGSFSCNDQKLARRSGRRLPPMALIADPLARDSRVASGPMGVGAESNDVFKGYRWEKH